MPKSNIVEVLEMMKPTKNYFLDRYFLKGHTKEDLGQYIDMAIVEGNRQYDPSKGMKRRTFLYMVIKRKIVSLIKREGYKKRKIHHNATSFEHYQSRKINEESTLTFHDIIDDYKNIENDTIISLELSKFIDSLSKMEKRSILGQAQGYSYEEIAQNYDYSIKAVDNAIQRARDKARRIGLDKLVV